MYTVKRKTFNKAKYTTNGFRFNGGMQTHPNGKEYKEWCVLQDGQIRAKCGENKDFALYLADLLNKEHARLE